MPEKTAVILGATGGVGSALTQRLTQHGYRLALVARNEEKLKALAASCPQAQHFCADAAQFDQVEAIFESINTSWGPIHGVAHCIGSILLKPAHRTSEAEWVQTLTQNLTTAFSALRAASKAMQKTGGSLVFCSSAAAQIGMPNHEAIAAAKAGIEGMVRSAAATYAVNQIRVNAVAPGLVETPLSEPLLKHPAAREAAIKRHPLQRLGHPADIANAMAWLLSDESSWVTGQVLSVDGGLAHVKTF